jgi:hypothetical protein
MTIAYLLIVWAVAADGAPTLPITISVQQSAAVCATSAAKEKASAAKRGLTVKVACRPAKAL